MNSQRKWGVYTVITTMVLSSLGVACGSNTEKASQTTVSNEDKKVVSEASQAASDKQPEKAKERRELTAMVMQSRNVPGLQLMVEKLKKEENIILDIQVTPDDQVDNLLKMKINSGEAPDLIDYNQPFICGVLDPDKYLADLSEEPWVERLISPSTIKWTDGKIYGFPFQSINGFQAIIYNKDVFKEAGIKEIPKTKKEFDEDCEKIKAIGKPAILMPSDSWCPQIWMTAGFALAVGDDQKIDEMSNKLFTNQDKLMNHPELAAVIDDFIDLFKKGYVNDDWLTVSHDECIERLAKAEAGMYYQNAIALTSNISNAFPDANIGMFVYPSDTRAADKLSVSASSIGFSLYKHSPNLETAKEVLRLFSEPEYCDLWYTQGRDSFPALKGVNGGKMNSEAEALYEEYQKRGATVNEMNNHWSTVKSLNKSTLLVYYQEAAQGKMTGAQLLERFQKDVDNYMKEKQAPGF